MSALGKLVVSLSLEHAAYTKGLDKAGNDAKAFERNASSSFAAFERSAVASAKNIAGNLVGVGAAFLSASTAINSLREAFQFADQILDVATANEVAVSSVLRLSDALTRSGGKSEDASKLLATFTNKVDEAAGGSESAQKQFAKLNISLNDLATLDGQQLFNKTLSGLNAITDPIQRNATAMDLLGKAVKGVDINGLADIYAAREPDFNNAEKSFKEIGDAMDKLDTFTLKASTSLAENFGPVLNSLITTVDDLIFGFDKLEEKIRKNRNQGASEFKSVPLITDKPSAGLFNLPAEYQNNQKRTVVDTAAEKGKQEAEKLAKSRAEIAERERKARNDAALRDAQQQIEFDDQIQEAKNKSEIEAEKARKEAEQKAYEQKLKNIDLLFEANQRRIEEERQLEEEAARAREEANRDFARSLTDALFRGFENGKDFLQNFKDTVINTFQTLILRPRIEAIFSGTGLGALLSGNANASTGGGNIFGDIKSSIDSLNTDFVGSIEKLGAWIANGEGGIRDTIGGFLGQNSGAIAEALPYSGAVLKLLQGDFKGAAFTGAGVALGNLIAPGIGGAIGGAIGNAVGGLFGGKDIPMVGSQAKGTFTGGVFTGKSSKFGDKDLGAGSSLVELSKAFSERLGGLFKTMGIDDTIKTSARFRKRTNVRGYFGAEFAGGRLGLQQISKNEDFSKYAEKVLGKRIVQAIEKSFLSTDIKGLFTGLTKSDTVKNMIDALNKLSLSSDQLDDRFGLTVDQSAAVAKATGLTGDALAAYISQLGELSYGYNTTEAVIKKAQARLEETFGGTLPDNIDAFDKRIKEVDKTTNEGVELTAKLLGMRGDFINYKNALEEFNATLVDSATALGLVDSSNFTDKASYEAARAFAAQGINGIYNSSNADLNGKIMINELQKLREAIAEVVKNTQATSASTLETARVLLNVTDGASLITTAG